MFDNPLIQEVIAEVYNTLEGKSKKPDDIDRREAMNIIKEKDSELHKELKQVCDKFEILSFVKRDNEMKIKGGDSWTEQIEHYKKEMNDSLEIFNKRCKEYNIDTEKINSTLNI